jgi:nicotinamide mononucleotide adenylyltransferase
MSGVAGGNRIKKENVEETFSNFISQVLRKIPGFTKASLSGSIKSGAKADYGDIDSIASFEGDDKKEVKQRIIDTISTLPSNIIIPFKSEKYKGRKFYNSGELISVLFPIAGTQGETIQVDIIISLSEMEHTFKNNFLDLSAEKQGLLIGLAKVIFIEEQPQMVLKRMGISSAPTLKENEEFEFNLSSVKLTLRKVTLDKFKESNREEIWNSSNWDDVEKLFINFDLSKNFDELLQELNSTLKNQRSKNRISGTFKSMVSVKSGEVGTPKGAAKEAAISKVLKTLAESLNDSSKVVAIYAGGFKPPHKAHFENAKILSKEADKLIIFVGPSIREGVVTVTPEQSKAIWEVYSKYLSAPTEIHISPVTPIKDTYDWIDENKDQVNKIITGTTENEMKKFASLIKKKEQYPNVELKVLDTIPSDSGKKFSATTIRSSEEEVKKGDWLPSLSPEDRTKVINILLTKLESFQSFFNRVGRTS